jgi:hypothetical protein
MPKKSQTTIGKRNRTNILFLLVYEARRHKEGQGF